VGVTTVSATAITLVEIMDLFYSLKSPYRKNAVFVMNDTTVKAIRKLKDGNGQYLWQPSIVAGEPETIRNKPVKTSAYAPAIVFLRVHGRRKVSMHYRLALKRGRSYA